MERNPLRLDRKLDPDGSNGILDDGWKATVCLRQGCEHQPIRRADSLPAQFHNNAKNLRFDCLAIRALNIPLVLCVAGANGAP
jgi:hypothetical protein